MKNIHILATSEASRLVFEQRAFIRPLLLKNEPMTLTKDSLGKIIHKPVHIYITDNSEISGFENNIWVIRGERIFLWQNTMALDFNDKPKKIILTTNETLIKQGVQKIEEDFLQWFCNNSDCEYVEVKKQYLTPLGDVVDYCYDNERLDYKIILPRENNLYTTMDNKETLEKAAENWDYLSFEAGANWQKQQDVGKYSEEDMINFGKICHNDANSINRVKTFKELFDKCKKDVK